MDENRFDGIAKGLGAPTPRRGVLALLAALATRWVVGGVETVDAKKNNKNKQRGKGNRGNRNKPECRGDHTCPGCLSCVSGRCRNIPEECDLIACQEMVCEPPTDGSAKSYYQCKSWCSGEEFCHFGDCCPNGVETCGVDCCATEEETCCNDQCVPPCSNGCEPDPGQDCQCKKAPPGTTYQNGVCTDDETCPEASCCSCVDLRNNGVEVTCTQQYMPIIDDCYDYCENVPHEGTMFAFYDITSRWNPGEKPVCGVDNHCQQVPCGQGG